MQMLTVDVLRLTFLWCFIFNSLLLLWWFAFFVFMHGFVYKMHTRWFKISEETFDTIHYAGMAIFKIFIIVFNFIPFIALWIAG